MVASHPSSFPLRFQISTCRSPLLPLREKVPEGRMRGRATSPVLPAAAPNFPRSPDPSSGASRHLLPQGEKGSSCLTLSLRAGPGKVEPSTWRRLPGGERSESPGPMTTGPMTPRVPDRAASFRLSFDRVVMDSGLAFGAPERRTRGAAACLAGCALACRTSLPFRCRLIRRSHHVRRRHPPGHRP